MSIQTTVVIAALVAIPFVSQVERAPAAATAATTVDTGACSVSLQGDQPVLATVIGRDGSADFTITYASGGAPSVQAMAINTKGTGASNGRSMSSSQGCAVRPSPGPTLTGTMRGRPPAASCVMSPDGDASVSVPLSAFGGDEAKAFKGHVTLLKRGDGAVAALSRDGWSAPVMVAACTAASGLKTGYDLAVAKKV